MIIATAESPMDSISTFDITKYPLFDVMKDIKIGRIQLPDFQRDWVWDDTHVRCLLASVSLAYPIGAVMMLQQGIKGQQFKPRLLDGVINSTPQLPNLLLLDGQQRLTTRIQKLSLQVEQSKRFFTGSKIVVFFQAIMIHLPRLMSALFQKECRQFQTQF